MELKSKLEAGDEIIVQIAPLGNYPAETMDGQPITQRFDPQSFKTLIEHWDKKPIRVDFDHASEISDNTIASGWIDKLYVDEESGLMGTLTVSKAGADALNGLEYRYLSPVFIFDETEHPIELVSVAYTNRPRLNMPAVWNTAPIELNEVLNAATTEEKAEEKTEEKPEETPINKSMDIEKLITILNLPAEATEEDILGTIKTLIDKIKENEDEKIEIEARETIDACSAIDEEKKSEAMNCYKKNPEIVKSLLGTLKKQSDPVINSADAKKPVINSKEELDKIPGGQKRVDYLLKHSK